MIHDILDLHTHTIMSGHAYNTMQEMIRSASEKGVQLLGITEHAPRIPGACHPFYFINFKVVPREQFGVKLMLGCELNIIDYEGHIDLEPRYLAGLDYGIASIHEPCYDSGTVAQNTAAYLGAMKHPAVHNHRPPGRRALPHRLRDSGLRCQRASCSSGGQFQFPASGMPPLKREGKLHHHAGAVPEASRIHHYGQRRPQRC